MLFIPEPPSEEDMPPGSKASVYCEDSPLARLRWQHPFFGDIMAKSCKFPEYGALLSGKYAWKVSCIRNALRQ